MLRLMVVPEADPLVGTIRCTLFIRNGANDILRSDFMGTGFVNCALACGVTFAVGLIVLF